MSLWLVLDIFVPLHYHLEVQANPKKNATKKPMIFLGSMGETGLSHDIFLNSHLGLAKFRGRSLKIQHRSSFDLNDLERPK